MASSVRFLRQGSAPVLAAVFVLACSFGVRAQDESSTSKSGAAKEPAAKEPTVKAPLASDYGVTQVKRINEEIRRVWADNKLMPSPQATDSEWCRRVYLDILGRVP